jgi:hypothetical protein
VSNFLSIRPKAAIGKGSGRQARVPMHPLSLAASEFRSTLRSWRKRADIFTANFAGVSRREADQSCISILKMSIRCGELWNLSISEHTRMSSVPYLTFLVGFLFSSMSLTILTNTIDEGNELALHGSVYNMAVSWGLSNNLQEIIFRNYKDTVENSWQPLAFLESVNIIFGLLRESGMVHAPGMSIIASEWLDPDRLREDRIAQLVVQQLETRREAFEDDSSIMLCQSLQNCPVLLRLFLQRWLVAKRKS